MYLIFGRTLSYIVQRTAATKLPLRGDIQQNHIHAAHFIWIRVQQMNGTSGPFVITKDHVAGHGRQADRLHLVL